MAGAGRIEIKILGDASSLSNALKSSAAHADGLGRSLGRLGKVTAVAFGAAALGGIAVVLRQGIAEWKQSAEVSAQTGAVLKSTGGIANVTAGDVDTLATALMRKSGIDDEQIQAGENWLLTFKNVRNEVGANNDIFNQATKASLDLAVAQSNAKGGAIDMAAASNMLGKALNDPVRGTVALGRAGVTFSTDQKEMIKSLVDTGNVLDAQKIILGEVTSQVGGSAVALGQTLPGQINIARESFNNLAGTIVGGLAPAFATSLTHVNDFLGRFADADGVSAKFHVAMDTVKSAVTTVAGALVDGFHRIDWAAVGSALKSGLSAAAARISEVDWSGQAKRVLTAVGDAIQSAPIGPAAASITRMLGHASTVAASAIRSAEWQQIGDRVATAIGRAIAGADASAISTGVIKLLSAIGWAGASVIVGIAGALGRAFTAGLVAALRGAEKLVGMAMQLGVKIMNGLWSGLKAIWAVVTAWFSGLGARVIGMFAGAGQWLYNAGAAIISGLAAGIESQVAGLLGKVAGIGGKIKGAITSALSIRSPSRVMMAVGRDIIRGLTNGITGYTQDAVAAMGQTARRLLAEVNKLQAGIDAVNARREREDRASAVRDAEVALAEARKKGEGIAAAEQTLQRAREDIVMAARERDLTAAQAHYDRLQTQLEKANEKIKAAQDRTNEAVKAAQQKALDAYQAALEKARTKAGATFDRFAELARKGFDALNEAWVAPSQEKVDAITGRRAGEDLAQAVTDAQARLATANEGDDPAAVAAAERALQRAKEDVVVAALEQRARDETAAHDKLEAAKADKFALALAKLRDSFTTTGVETDKGMTALLKIVNSYGGGFKSAGELLGGYFADALRDAMSDAVASANNVVGAKTRSSAAAIVDPFGVPHLSSGGFITGTGLALVHRGETVVPAGARAGGGGITLSPGAIVVNGWVGNDQDIAARLVNTINSGQRVGKLRFAS